MSLVLYLLDKNFSFLKRYFIEKIPVVNAIKKHIPVIIIIILDIFSSLHRIPKIPKRPVKSKKHIANNSRISTSLV